MCLTVQLFECVDCGQCTYSVVFTLHAVYIVHIAEFNSTWPVDIRVQCTMHKLYIVHYTHSALVNTTSPNSPNGVAGGSRQELEADVGPLCQG